MITLLQVVFPLASGTLTFILCPPSLLTDCHSGFFQLAFPPFSQHSFESPSPNLNSSILLICVLNIMSLSLTGLKMKSVVFVLDFYSELTARSVFLKSLIGVLNSTLSSFLFHIFSLLLWKNSSSSMNGNYSVMITSNLSHSAQCCCTTD